jgi:hypothetical protein
VSDPPAGKVATVSEIGPVPLAFGQTAPPDAAQVQVNDTRPVGMGSSMCVPSAGPLPELTTVKLKVTFWPAVALTLAVGPLPAIMAAADVVTLAEPEVVPLTAPPGQLAPPEAVHVHEVKVRPGVATSEMDAVASWAVEGSP